MTNDMLRYVTLIYWSDDDEAFIAEVPELAGCAADGPTQHEALANAPVIAQEWIDTARELSREIPEH
ncbi:type II toxin-antitoxin system HicB family antitoxin [soil metagenome]